MKIIRIIIALGALVVVCFAVLISQAKKPLHVIPGYLTPESQRELVVLQPEDSREFMRVYKLGDDGITRQSAEVFFRDQSTGYINYRRDGSVSSYGSSYPANESGKTQVRSEAAFAQDGESLLFEYHYRVDGTVHRAGKRTEDGNFAVELFFDDGVTVAGTELYNKAGQLQNLRHVYADGTLKHTFESTKWENETVKYWPTGKKKYYHHQKYTTDETWEHYQEDGVTPIMTFKMVSVDEQQETSYHVLARYFNPDGSLNHQRRFHRSHMIVQFVDGDGNITLTQKWRHLNWAYAGENDLKMDQEQYELHAIFLGSSFFKADDSFFFYNDSKGKNLRRHMFGNPLEGLAPRHLSHKDYDEKTGFLRESSAYHREGDIFKSKTEKFAPGESTEKFDYSLIPTDYDRVIDYVIPPRPPWTTDDNSD